MGDYYVVFRWRRAAAFSSCLVDFKLVEKYVTFMFDSKHCIQFGHLRLKSDTYVQLLMSEVRRLCLKSDKYV